MSGVSKKFSVTESLSFLGFFCYINCHRKVFICILIFEIYRVEGAV